MIDILATYDTACPSFVVDTSQTDVTVVAAAGTPVVEPEKLHILPYFSPGDSFTIISFGIALPYSFVQGTFTTTGVPQLPMIFFTIIESGYPGAFYLPGMGKDLMYVPYLGAEIPTGFFVDMGLAGANYHGNKFQLKMAWSTLPMISMIGAPSSLNTQRLYCPFWVKVEHSIPFTA